MIPDFSQLSLVANIPIFIVSAVIVWQAGYRISRMADRISAKTGLGHALLGLLFLGGVTSLPELAVVVTASLNENASLAISNVLGGVTMQVAILAVADVTLRKRALTAVIPDSVVLLQGSLNIILLTLVAVAVVVGDRGFLGIGLWTWAIFIGWILSIWLLAQAEQRRPWLANIEQEEERTGLRTEGPVEKELEESLGRLLAAATVAAFAILAAGFVVTRTGEVIAEQSGLGASFFGAVFIAVTTSLPELSTVLSAVRMGFYTMAVSDILGTNLFDVAMIFLVDALSGGPPVLNEVGNFAVVAALMGCLVTALYLVGLAERRDKTIFGLSFDSIAVFIVYFGGVAILYTMRG